MVQKSWNLVALVVLAFLGERGEAFSFNNGGEPSRGVRLNNSSSMGRSSSGGTNPPSRKEFLQASGIALTALLVPRKSNAVNVGGKIKYGDEDIMSPKEHGTSAKPVQPDLRFEVNNRLADKICNFNRWGNNNSCQCRSMMNRLLRVTSPANAPLFDRLFTCDGNTITEYFVI